MSGSKSSPSELEVEIITSIVLDTLRKEMVNAFEASGLDATSVYIDAILIERGTKNTIEENVRLTMDRDGMAGALKAHNPHKHQHTNAITVKKASNAKKEIVKHTKQSYRPKAAG